MSTANPEIDEVTVSSTLRAKWNCTSYGSIKPVLDFALALVVLVISFPIILLALVLVRLTSRGPLIYTQKRVGLRGTVFTIYKIRTMYHDSERTCGPRWCVPGDRRVTPIGRLLRWSHVDELPQLVNILMGEMSLIGPRPERPEFVAELERVLPNYRRRLRVRPGLTGLAQVRQPPDTDIVSVRRKLNYDLYYVERMNPWLDFRLVLGTVFKCLGIPFNWIGRVFQLPDPNVRLGRESRLLEPELTASSLVSNPYMQ